jgi:hypothetical protein
VFMIDPAELSLWNQFNLAENNPDPGGGILYAIRYDTEGLLAHRDAITEAIVDSGARISEVDDRLGIDASAIKSADRPRVAALLEELSVVSEAIEYHEEGVTTNSIAGLSDHLRGVLLTGLVTNQLVAFDFANITIPQIVRDIETAHDQNNVLRPEEQRTVRDLGEFAARRAKQIASNSIIIIGL